MAKQAWWLVQNYKPKTQELNKYIDEDKFITYLDSLSNSAMSSICTKLKPYCPNITEFNLGKECATLFKSILEESATTSKRKKQLLKRLKVNMKKIY